MSNDKPQRDFAPAALDSVPALSVAWTIHGPLVTFEHPCTQEQVEIMLACIAWIFARWTGKGDEVQGGIAVLKNAIAFLNANPGMLGGGTRGTIITPV